MGTCLLRRAVLAWVAFGLLFLAGAGHLEAQPANDSYVNRTVIATLPFTDTQTAIALATVEATDPNLWCRIETSGAPGNTVWYSYAAGSTDEYLDFNTSMSDYDTIVAIYTGSPGALTLVGGGCNDNGTPPTTQARISGLRLRANTTYSIVVARAIQSASPARLDLWVEAAPVYRVTKTSDTADGMCDLDCSLREAIGASNTIPGAVLVPPGKYILARPGLDPNNTSGDLDVLVGMGIYGDGSANTVIDAGQHDRVVDIDPVPTNSISAHLSGLTLINGRTTDGGGGLRVSNTGNFLTLEDVVVANNASVANAGGLFLESAALLQRVTLGSNQAGGIGGGALFQGNVTVRIRDSTISHNVSLSPTSGGGGGIYSQVLSLRLDQTTISSNRANFSGGGLLLASGSLSMRNSTVVANVADADNNDSSSGGGVHFGSGNTNSSIANSVVANNYTDSIRTRLNVSVRRTAS